ncbi:ABC transporter permease [Lachnotalea sp. AF33-28]|uniref:ABC transporter permease n=1 Tax=Lachnotalea sp. AF33-28 TaxID=2292046 RepID=UPI0026C80EB6|nr:ABC transporter permease subunit [Lachnotalea sp. AF33-28]
MKRKKGKYLSFHLMLLIPTALLVVYCYVPMAGIIIAFQNYKPALGFTGSKFTGLENFRVLFTNPGFMQALKNTVVIAFWKIITGLIVPVTFSLLLNEIRRSSIKRTAQTIIYMPYFISWVLMAGIIVDILSPENGIVNRLLGLFGVEPVFFLGDNNWFKPVLVVTNVWKEFGWGTIIYMAALTGIDLNLYEAAAIDGAGRWKQTLHVTLPGIAPTIVLLTTLSLGNVLNAGFDQVYNLMSPITLESGDIIDTLIYRLGIKNAQFGIATAAGLFKSMISAFFIVTSYKLAYKFTGYRVF